MSNLCPRCGHNLDADTPIERGHWSLTPQDTWWDGKQITLTPAQNIILHSVAAVPNWITRDALLNRASSSEDINTVSVQLGKMRRRLEYYGAPYPIESRWEVGVRWRDA